MKIEVLFPEIANLFGEGMNSKYLSRCLPDAEVVKTSLKETPAFLTGHVDIVLMGAMSERSQALAIEALRPNTQAIASSIDAGQPFLFTSNAMELFWQYIENEDGSRVEALGLFDFYAKRCISKRYNSLFLGQLEEIKVLGFKSQFSHTYGDNSNCCLFETLRGDGLHPGSKWEGIRKNNFMGTYLLGPLLVLNPYFTKYLMRLLGVSDPSLPFEETNIDVYTQRLSEFTNPKTLMQY